MSDSLYKGRECVGLSLCQEKSSACSLLLDVDLSKAVPEKFTLKEVAGAVMSFLGKAFAKVKVEVSNLCSDTIALVGDMKQLQGVLDSAISCLEKTFEETVELVSVIIHELKRPSDGDFLLRNLFQIQKEEGVDSVDRKNQCKEICSKYIAISVKKKIRTLLSKSSDPEGGKVLKEEVSYYDGGLIVKSGNASVVIYISKLETV